MDQNRTRPEAQSQPGKDPKPASVAESLNRGKDAIRRGRRRGHDRRRLRSAGDQERPQQPQGHARQVHGPSAGSEAAKSARDASASVAGQVKDAVGDTVGGVAGDLADKGVEFAATAGEQAKTLAAELEAMARRNPLGALAGALAIGFLIGVWGRRS
jgi:hypothetical protein